MSVRRWKLGEPGKREAEALKEDLGVSGLAAKVMVSRGLSGKEMAREFIGGGSCAPDPFALKDMDRAVARIHSAIDGDELIAVFGDYDVDGLTATTLMYRCLSSLGARTVCSLPSRDDTGYGLSREAIDSLSAAGVTLIVTVDNGISAFEEVEYASSLGIDTVITDHHMAREQIPAAVAVVNPHRLDDGSSFKDLAGVGVALKLAAALEGMTVEEAVEVYGLLAAIGTVADIMPLVDENRCIVRRGLSQFPECDIEGLKALFAALGQDYTAADENSVSYVISPHLNAAGRMGNAELALSLLLTEDPGKAAELADELIRTNAQRREEEQRSIAVINRMLQEDPSLVVQPVLIVAGSGFHPGVMGIVCSRLVEQYHKPVIIISVDGEEGKGSGRSVEGVSLYAVIENCEDLLIKFGGHEMAAGFAIAAEKIPEFRERVAEYCRENSELYRAPELWVDAEVDPSEVTEQAVNGLRVLAPFGSANREPCFLIRRASVAGIYRLGSGRNTRVMLRKNGESFYAACFGVDPDDFLYPVGSEVDAVMNYTVYNGHVRSMVSAKVADIRSSCFTDEDLDTYEQYRRYRISGKVPEGDGLRIDRSDAAAVYRRIRAEKIKIGDDSSLAGRFCGQPLGKVFVLLDVFNELGLIRMEERDGHRCVCAVPDAPKRDLRESELFRRLSRG